METLVTAEEMHAAERAADASAAAGPWTVRQLAAWLAAFADQEATVEVVVHRRDGSPYERGGTARTAPFAPSHHAEYTDLRNNKFIKPGQPGYNTHTLLLGVIDG